ncbi:hypothetical protein [Agrobacterium rosae]|uniref:hypothetical protein n=1 Tax=Agrobacterium rosae TaxID=1972867 RepID=UPI003BA3977D
MSMAVAFGTFEMTPEKFSVLADHSKSELCRLLLEGGRRPSGVARVCGITQDALRQTVHQRHSFVMGNYQGNRADVPEGPLTQKQKDDVTDQLSIHHCRLLVRFPHDGIAYWKSQRTMELQAGIKFGDGPRIMEKLYESRLVERAPPRRGFEQCWALTELGADLRSSMNPDDVESYTKAKQ